MRQTSLIWLSPILFFLGCQTAKDQLIRQKNQCYTSKLNTLKEHRLYKDVRASFVDTFSIIQKSRLKQPLFEEKVDDALFFKADSLECLLIVVQRHYDSLGFGSARIYRGELFDRDWKFKRSILITFDGYNDKYSDNSFENISEVARYVVLTNGEVNVSGCDIDEYFWFEHMKE